MEHYLEAIRQQARIERAHEALLKLPLPVVLALVWLAGTMLLCLCATALYMCWLLLQAVA
jgi:hypothetical protein